MPRPQPTDTSLVPTLPGEGVVIDSLIDEAVGHLNRLYAVQGLQTARLVGEYLLATFFDGDPARFHARGKDHLSFAQLAAREELAFSASFLWSACAVVEQLQLLPADLGGELPMSHHKLLLAVKDPAAKQTLARAAVEEGLSKRAFEERLQKARPAVPPESRPGRRPLPAVVKGMTKLKNAVKLASSEEIAGLEARQARELLADVDAQVAALAGIRASVEAALRSAISPGK